MQPSRRKKKEKKTRSSKRATPALTLPGVQPPRVPLDAPCPCRRGRRAADCCAPDGVVRPTPFEALNRKTDAARVAGCYAGILDDCEPPISGEHILSATILGRLETERGLFIRGPAWQHGKWLPVRSLGANVLCKGHNSGLSELDARMSRLGDQIFQLGDDLVRQDPSPWLFAINGYDVERWMLKVLCGMRAGGHAATEAGDRYERTVPEQWVRILFGRDPMPTGWGLHVNVQMGQQMQFGVRELKAAPMSIGGNIVGVVVDVFGWELVLAMVPVQPERAEGALNSSSMYRPALLQNPTPAGMKAIYFHWEPGARGR